MHDSQGQPRKGGGRDAGGGSGQARKEFQVSPPLHPHGALQSHPALRQRGFCTLGPSVIGRPRDQGGVCDLSGRGKCILWRKLQLEAICRNPHSSWGMDAQLASGQSCWEDEGDHRPSDSGDARYRAGAHSQGFVTPRISGISMDVALPEDTGQDPALEVEQCTCPPGYRGPSCQVSPGPHTPVQPAPSTVGAPWLLHF